MSLGKELDGRHIDLMKLMETKNQIRGATDNTKQKCARQK